MPDTPEALVVIVDDDPDIRDSLLALLHAHGRPARAYDSVDMMIRALRPDICGCLLLDIRMPDIDGVSALPGLRERFPCLLPVMITAHADVDAAVAAMKSGAVDFLRKPWKTADLLGAVDDTLGRATRLARALNDRKCARRTLDGLTPREREVFAELVTGAANKVVARRLDLSPRTVEFHRARIFEKTGLASVAELVQLKAAADRELVLG